MALCPYCHDEATKGAMPEHEQRALKSAPHNIRQGYAEGLLKVTQDHCTLVVGSCDIVNDGAAILVNEEVLVGLEIVDGQLTLSITLYDENDNLLLCIHRNEWISGDPMVWDLEADHQKLLIRQRLGDVRLRLRVSDPMSLTALLWREGNRIDIRPTGVSIDGIKVQGVGFDELCFVGARIHVKEAGVSLEPDPRFGESMIVSWPDRHIRRHKGLQALARLHDAHPEARSL